jgi:hypothetical protein
MLPLGGLYAKYAVQGTNSTFALGPKKTVKNLDRVGRSQDLLDAN